MPWEEVSKVQQEGRHELVLSGPEVAQRIETEGLDPLVLQLESLNFLSISKTALEQLPTPDGGIRLPALTKLCVYENRLAALPATFAQLATLKHLDLSNNRLVCLPDNLLTDLLQLEVLNLSNNQLESLPRLGPLSHLLDMYLSNNRLTALPDGIDRPELSSLLSIRANNNSIEALPPSLSRLPCLRVLDLENNRVTELPADVSGCAKLRELNLKGNKIADRRLKKMLEDDKVQCASVLEYLRKTAASRPGQATAKAAGKKQKKQQQQQQRLESETGDGDDADEAEAATIDIRHWRPESDLTARLHESVLEVRPYLVLCAVRNIDLASAPGRFKAFLACQQALHDGLADRRQKLTVASHDLDKIRFPLTFEARPPAEIVFRPLKSAKEESAAELFRRLRQEAEDERKAKKRNTVSGVHRYLSLLEGRPAYPVLLDRDQRVLSLPPITNAELSRIGPETRNLLLEVSGHSRLELCKQAMEQLISWLLSSALKDDPANEAGLAIEQVRTLDWEGGLRVVYPSRTDLVSCETSSCRFNRPG
ncbi:hypothetical protein BOX15_Mlig007814g3 [Macrostomum lignano]|uniref:B3_4 domain-containing protein n=2 Tax=Macrostomum lignano TaxID=282301 RepID=A0A1I8JIW5_9PLAT|nr:hypothetical protein BOX15_Mlig007814g3 [Macrostomum lignano]